MPDNQVKRSFACSPSAYAAMATALCSCVSALGDPVTFSNRHAAEFWTDDVTSHRIISGEAVRTWTLASGNPLTSISENWNPIATPVNGDDIVFGVLKSGSYSVVQNLGVTFNNLTVNRTLNTELLNFSGVYSGSSFRVARGAASVSTTAFNVNAVGLTNNTSSIVAGDGLGNVGSITFTGVNGTYYDARVGVNGSTGVLQLTGINTVLLPSVRNVTPSVFGGTADAANATVLVDAATVEAWVITTGIRGSMKFMNAAKITSVPTPEGTGQIQIGSPDASNVSFEVSAGSSARINGQDGIVLIGSGAGAVTNTKVLSGGSIVADLLMTGSESVAGTTSSENTVLISGAGSTVTTTEGFETNGGYRFLNNRRGNTIVNVTAGGRVYTPRYDANAMDRSGNSGAASSTTLLIDGSNSLMLVRTDVGGLFVGSLGDYTSDTTTVSNYGKLDAGQIALAVGVGSTSTLTATRHGTILTGMIELARPLVSGATSSANLVASDAGTVRCTNIVTSGSASATTNITVRDALSSLICTGVVILNGETNEALGGGNTTMQLLDGGNATLAALQAGGASAAGAGTGYFGSQIAVTGPGSQLTLTGVGNATPQATDLAANLVLSANTSTRSSMTVAGGAGLRIQDNSTNPNLDGSIALSTASNTVSSLLVDGPDTTVDAGKIVMMSEAPIANGFANASSTITVRNGGFMGVYENTADPASGNLQMAIRPSLNSTATLNIGGGTNIADPDSTIAIDGTLFVGGSGDTLPVVGGRSTVNLANGNLAAAALAVYANSKVNITGGHLATDNLLVVGGRVDMSSTTSIAIELGALRFSNGGVLNVGKGGAVVYYSTANGSPSDIAAIRQAVYNGSNGGAWNGQNGITSSLLSVTTPAYAIGYADIDVVGLTSFLDLTFDPGVQAVVFRYTLRGDANLSGTVDFSDLLLLAQHYGAPFGSEWSDGDFNYTQRVDFDDLLLLSQNYGLTLLSSGQTTLDPAAASRFASDWALARTLVPEPATAALFGVACLLIRRRRHV